MPDVLKVAAILALVVILGLSLHVILKRWEERQARNTNVTIEQFYEKNPRRRESKEVDLGKGWRAASEPRCTFKLFWVEETGELCALRIPTPRPGVFDGEGDYWMASVYLGEAIVEVLGRVATRSELDERLAGWEGKASDPDGVGWIKDQLSTG